MFTLIYSFVGCFAALVVYNLFGGKQFVQKKINEAKEESKKEEDQLQYNIKKRIELPIILISKESVKIHVKNFD